MNTCEMLKAIEGTNKTFIDQFGNRIDFADDGYLCWNTGQVFMITRDILESSEWEEVKELVSFTEVLEEVRENRNTTITMKNFKYDICIYDEDLVSLIIILTDQIVDVSTVAELLLTSKFYVDDEEV